MGIRSSSGLPTRTAVSLAFEWLDYVEKMGTGADELQHTHAERLGVARPWSEVEPLWQTDEVTAWDAAKDRARRMRELLGVKRWWLALSEFRD